MIPICKFFVGQKVYVTGHTGRNSKEWDFLNFMRGKPATIKSIYCTNVVYNDSQCNGDCYKCKQYYITLEETNELSWGGQELTITEDRKMKNVWDILIINKETDEVLARELVIDGDEKSACSKVSIRLADKLKNLVFNNLYYVAKQIGSYE
jgi:hypothetical protein